MTALFGDISLEAVATAAIVGAAAVFATLQLTSPSAPSQPQPTQSQGAKGKKKSKAKGKSKEEVEESEKEVLKPAPSPVTAIPGDFDTPKVDLTPSAPAPKKKNKTKKKKAATGATESQVLSSPETSVSALPKPAVVEPPTAPAVASQPTTESSESAVEIESSDDASQAGATTPTRSTASESSVPVPAAGFSWGDYEDGHDVEDDDEGWGVVKRSKHSRKTDTIIPATANKPATSVNAPLSKRQRQNAADREKKKAAKALAEKERLATLAKHKKELEKVRMAEQSSHAASHSKVSGGMSATVDEHGKLVWE